MILFTRPHGGVPAVGAGGVHDDQEDDWQGGHVAANVRDNVPTTGEDTQDRHEDDGAGVDVADVQAKEVNEDDNHDDTNDTVVIGPEVPIDEGGKNPQSRPPVRGDHVDKAPDVVWLGTDLRQ